MGGRGTLDVYAHDPHQRQAGMGEHPGLRDAISERDSGGDVRPVTEERVSWLLGQRVERDGARRGFAPGS
jgi:hypothetical protein